MILLKVLLTSYFVLYLSCLLISIIFIKYKNRIAEKSINNSTIWILGSQISIEKTQISIIYVINIYFVNLGWDIF